MARPIDSSLKYFPLDVDFYDDPKILMIEEQFGIKGSYIASRLLCWIYRNGYYIYWNEDMALIFAKRVGNGFCHSFVNNVVNALVLRRFFNKALFERCAILTSAGIQKRWVRIIQDSKRKAQLSPEFDLLNVSSKDDDKLIQEEIIGVKEETIGKKELTTGETEESTQRIEKNRITKNNINTGGGSDCKFVSSDFKKIWNDWVEYRSQSRHKLTDQTIKKQVGFLEKYSEETAIEILIQSIKNGWQGLFPLKIEKNGTKPNKSDQRESEWKQFNNR